MTNQPNPNQALEDQVQKEAENFAELVDDLMLDTAARLLHEFYPELQVDSPAYIEASEAMVAKIMAKVAEYVTLEED